MGKSDNGRRIGTLRAGGYAKMTVFGGVETDNGRKLEVIS
jgi:hypothetical protein